MNIDYEDERFKKVEQEKTEAINKSNELYDSMISSTDSKYSELTSALENNAETQKQIQQESTNQTINEINQNKDKLQTSYEKEQKAAYNDYQKVINDYGEEAENMASSGLTNSGFSESSQMAAFSVYQNRKAVAKQSYQDAVTEYDNQINQAKLNNDSILAQIASDTFYQKAQYLLEAFQYKNDLLQTKLGNEQTLNSEYEARRQQVYNDIISEKQYLESVRQYNEQMAYQKQRDAIEDAQWQKSYNLSLANTSSSNSNTGYSVDSSSQTSSSDDYYNTHKWTSSVAREVYKWADGGYSNRGQTNEILLTVENCLNKGIMSEEEANKILDLLGI